TLFLRAILFLSGHDTSFVGGRLLVDSGYGATAIVGDHWKTTAFLTIASTAAFAIVAFRRRARALALRSSLVFFGLAVLFAFLRFSALTMHLITSSPMDMGTIVSGPSILWSFAPIPLLAAWLAGRGAWQRPVASPGRLAYAYSLVAVAGVLLVTIGFYSHEQGSARPGKILFDEAHSGWEGTSVPFDRDAWGRKATYNYRSMADLLDRWYGLDKHEEGLIDAARLDGVQIVILKTPTTPFSPDEIAAIEAHVQDGGGLFLIGDHTNLFGMGEYLNGLAERFGFRFNYDSTFDALSGGTTAVEPQRIVHPIGAASTGMAFQTSCSITPLRPDFEPIFVGRRLTAELADYGNPNFFGNITTELEDRSGAWVQALAVQHGKGRVVAFSDSTIFSNFSLYDEGTSEFVQRTIEYLSQSPSLPRGARELALLAGLLLVGFAATRLRAQPLAGRLLVPVAATLAVALAGQLEQRSFDLATPCEAITPFVDVSFVLDASSMTRTSFIEDAMIDVPAAIRRRAMGNFFTVVQRVSDLRPRRDQSIKAAIEAGAEVLVLTEPAREPREGELEALAWFVAGGGRLLILDDLRNANVTTADTWLSPFGLHTEVQSVEREAHTPIWPQPLVAAAQIPEITGVAAVSAILTMSHPQAGPVLGKTQASTRLSACGGTPLIVDDAGGVVAAYRDFGRGQALVYTQSAGLSDAVLGTRADLKPEPEEIAAGQYAVDLVRRMLIDLFPVNANANPSTVARLAPSGS
ncbi:MAG: hypothetical protein KDB53_13385, partial [Planctomycetes bacterium]|nr:hypothetical protein [Planctomycetota bacterium]